MSDDCLFCKIIRGEIKSEVVDRDEHVLVLRDINPQAPIHLLILPIEHLSGVVDITETRRDLIARLVLKANEMATRAGLGVNGYRLAINQGKEGGQTVGHLHLHVLGGRALSGRLG